MKSDPISVCVIQETIILYFFFFKRRYLKYSYLYHVIRNSLPLIFIHFFFFSISQFLFYSLFRWYFRIALEICVVHSSLNIILAHILIFTFAPFSISNKFMHLMEELLVLSPFTTMICTVRDTPLFIAVCDPVCFFPSNSACFASHFAFSLISCPLTAASAAEQNHTSVENIHRTCIQAHTYTYMNELFYICTGPLSLHAKWHFCAW